MTPIINPSLFYWLQIADAVQIILGIVAILGVMLLVVITIVRIINMLCDDLDDKSKKKLNKLTIKGLIISIIFGLLSCFTPSKQTCIEMLVASQITPDNLAAIGETAEDGLNYISEFIVNIDNALDNNKDE